MRNRALFPILALVLALDLAALHAQQCPDGTVGATFWDEALQTAALQIGLDEPLASPPSQQLTAPADSEASTSLVNGAGFPNLLAIAAENGLVNSENGALTVNLNLFGFRALASPEVLDKQSEYVKYNFMRRFGGALSFGGKGESFDRDNDGQADPALEAEELGDIVNWELRYRFAGSRDRRERINVKDFFKDTDSYFKESTQQFADFFSRHTAEIAATQSATNPSCFDRQKIEAWVQRPDIAEELVVIARSIQKLDAAIKSAHEQIDRSTVWSVFAGGISRRDQFGPDTRKAGLRGAMGGDDQGFTFNLEWSQVDGIGGAKDPTQWKAGLEYAMLALKGLPLTGESAQNGIRVSFSGSYEQFEDVPAAKYDTNAKANVKLELPISDSVKIPVSVTWANHKDLIEGEDEIRGHIGFTLDLSKLRDAVTP